MRALRQGSYKLAGDEIFGFDPNAFVQRLIEETGISHVWEPIPTRIPEGGFEYGYARVTLKGPPDPKREAKRESIGLLWDVWSRNFNFQSSQDDKETFAHIVAILFASFAIDNIDLAREFMSPLIGGEGGRPLGPILAELERRAQGWKPFA